MSQDSETSSYNLSDFEKGSETLMKLMHEHLDATDIMSILGGMVATFLVNYSNDKVDTLEKFSAGILRGLAMAEELGDGSETKH